MSASPPALPVTGLLRSVCMAKLHIYLHLANIFGVWVKKWVKTGAKKCVALLLDSMKDHGSLTKPEIVNLLWNVLPDQLNDKQREYKINNILRKLRLEGLICNTTLAGNKSTWALVNNQK